MFDMMIEDANIIRDFLKPVREYLEDIARHKKTFLPISRPEPRDLVGLIKNLGNKDFLSNIDKIVRDKGNIKFKKIIKNLNESSRFMTDRKFLNSNIGNLIKSGPNLLSNMYDVYFTIYTPSQEIRDFSFLLLSTKYPKNNTNNTSDDESIVLQYNKDNHKVLTSLTEDIYSLSVRTASVSIPQRKINTASPYQFESTEVTIPASDWSMANEASLSVNLDSNLYIYDIFNNLSGLIRPGYSVNNNGRKIDDEYKIMTPNGLRKNDCIINLSVAAHSLSGFSNLAFNDYDNNLNNILFEFEDIKFLGTSDDIGFSNESSKGKSINIPFIFKNLKTVYIMDYEKANNEVDSGVDYKDLSKKEFVYY